MKVKFVERNYKIADRFKEVMSAKLEKLDRYFGASASATCNCIKQGRMEKLEITIKNKGLLFRSEVTSDNMYDNIDLALPKLERQIVRHREKKIDSKKTDKKVKDAVESFEFIEEMPEVKLPDVAKVKKFELVPTQVEDAKDAIERLGHSFYIFLNAETGKVNVLYRRNDGKYGLIEAEV